MSSTLGIGPIKVKVMALLQKFSRFATIQVLYLGFDTGLEVIIKYVCVRPSLSVDFDFVQTSEKSTIKQNLIHFLYPESQTA